VATGKDRGIIHALKEIDAAKSVTPEKTGVLLSSSIRTKMENIMTLNFFGSIAKLLCGRNMSAGYRRDLMTWAKIEYSKDWEFAYNYMINNNGKAPKHTDTRGTIL
jgi:hypothetical protein